VELTNEFEVAVPIEEAWAVLTDLERIAPCMPGAQLTEVEGDEYRGLVKVKVGPITASYKGVVRFSERDAENHRAVLKADGRETRGQGNASATITATLAPSGTGTKVSVFTDLAITGKVAQFGRGVLADVSGKLLDQFVHNLETTVLTPDAPGAPAGEAEPAAGEGAPEPAGQAAAPERAAPSPKGAGAESSAPGDHEAGSAGDDAAPGLGDTAAGSAEAKKSGAGESAGPGAKRSAGTEATPPAAAGSSEASDEAEPIGVRHIQSAPAEAVDLVGVAGSSILKRIVPFASAAGLLVLIRIIIYAMKRRKR